jgi:dihydrofolate synthase / folylpolyglutamate synthase
LGFFGEVFNSVSEAYAFALQEAGTNDLIYVGGSTFVVAEIV